MPARCLKAQRASCAPHAPAGSLRRLDTCLSNIVVHHPSDPAPPLDAAGIAGFHHSWLGVVELRTKLTGRMRYNAAMPLPVIGGLSGRERQQLHEKEEARGRVETESLFTGLDRAWQQQPGGTGAMLSKMWGMLGADSGMAVEGAAGGGGSACCGACSRHPPRAH